MGVSHAAPSPPHTPSPHHGDKRHRQQGPDSSPSVPSEAVKNKGVRKSAKEISLAQLLLHGCRKIYCDGEEAMYGGMPSD